MAYGLKYTSTFWQIKPYSTDGEWQINIYLEGYAGSSTEFNTVANSIKKERSGDFKDVIRPTTLEFSVYNETEGQFLEFSDANWGDYKVELIFDPNGTPSTNFIGYNQTEIYTEPMEQVPYPSVLKFTDGLKHLDYVRFSDFENDVIETSINTNSTASVSASIAMPVTVNGAYIKIEAATGDHENHIVTLQTSPDNAVWSNSAYNVIGVKSLSVEGLNTSYIRLKVTTTEGATSTVNWSLKPRYTGEKAIIETLRLALNKLPNPINIFDSVNVYDDSMSSSNFNSMMTQTFTNMGMYKEVVKDSGEETEEPFMCSRVIEEILKPLYCHIYQSDGKWYIVRKQEYNSSGLTYREFNPDVGTENNLIVPTWGALFIQRTINNQNSSSTDIIMPSASAEKEVIPPVNRLKLTYTQQNLDIKEANLIKNGDFLSLTSAYAPAPLSKTVYYPNFWGYSGFNPSIYDGVLLNIFDANGFQFDPSSYTTSVGSLFKYMSQTKGNIHTATTDILRLSFDTRVYVKRVVPSGTPILTTGYDGWITNSIEVVNHIRIRIGTYYLAGNNINGFSWSTIEQECELIQKGSNNKKDSNIGGGSLGINNFMTYWNNNFAIDLPKLPQNGTYDFEFRFYETYTDVPSYDASNTDYTITLDSVYYSNLRVEYLPDESPAATEQIIYADINEDENIEEIDVIHGDGGTSISQSSFRLSSGAITDLWARRGVTESTPILELLIESIRDDNSDFKDQLNATLIGEIQPYETMRMTIGAVTKDYLQDSYTYMIESNEVEVRLIEIETFTKPISLTDFETPVSDVDQTISFKGAGDSDTIPAVATPTSTTSSLELSVASLSTGNQTNLTNYN